MAAPLRQQQPLPSSPVGPHMHAVHYAPAPPHHLHHPQHQSAASAPPPQINGHPAMQAQPQQKYSFNQYLEEMWLKLGRHHTPLFARPAFCFPLKLIFSVLGNVDEVMGEPDQALLSYEHALRVNNHSITALNSIATILRAKEQFDKAVEYLKTILQLDSTHGEVWGSLGRFMPKLADNLCADQLFPGHCYLMTDNLQEAYQAYQQALYHLKDPKVRAISFFLSCRSIDWLTCALGTQVVVRHRHSVRSLWLF
jgi:general transcriptional corepressor CYC8